MFDCEDVGGLLHMFMGRSTCSEAVLKVDIAYVLGS